MSATFTSQAIGAVAFVCFGISLAAGPPAVQWGPAQEGIKVGLAVIDGSGSNARVGINIYAAPAASYSNNFIFPELSQALVVTLRNRTNNAIEPRPGAKRFAAPLDTKLPRREGVRRQIRFPDQEGWVFGGFWIDDCFLVKETRDYELEVQIRLLKELGDRLVPVTFLPIKLKVRLVANAPS